MLENEELPVTEANDKKDDSLQHKKNHNEVNAWPSHQKLAIGIQRSTI